MSYFKLRKEQPKDDSQNTVMQYDFCKYSLRKLAGKIKTENIRFKYVRTYNI